MKTLILLCLVIVIAWILFRPITRKELEDSAAKVFNAILSGKIKVEVFKKYSLNEVKKAHEDLEARLLTGPVVILP